MHRLVVIAATGLAACAVCVGAAAAIDGDDFRGDEGFSFFDGRPTCQAVAGATASSRTMEWDGSDHAGLNLQAQARYTPGSDGKLHASGDPQVLAHLRIRNGTVELDCRGWRDRTRDVTIAFPGRSFENFGVTGGRLTIDRLEQQRVSIGIAGGGKVQAAGGKFEDAHFSIAGAGEMDMGPVTAASGKLDIAGSGTMRAQNVAIDDLKMGIAGSGRFEVAGLSSRTTKAGIAGSGTVIAKGAVSDLKIEIAGSGRANFGEVAARTVKVNIGGHGDVDIAPIDLADIHIGGSGDVTLHSDPKQLETHIGGSGRIHRLAGNAT